ncbi:hypothetical protein Holit_01784 [Hollandina sp. SP2]
MSWETEEGGWPDEAPQGEGAAGIEATAQAVVPPVFRAIEEHAKARGLSAPVFAAVRQMKGWSEGKKVEVTEFNEAVNTFLGAPIGGTQ